MCKSVQAMMPAFQVIIRVHTDTGVCVHVMCVGRDIDIVEERSAVGHLQIWQGMLDLSVS